MSCSEFVELVTDYLEGRMAATEASASTPTWRSARRAYYLDQMRVTLDGIGRIPEETISDAARAELLNAFTDFHSRRALSIPAATV